MGQNGRLTVEGGGHFQPAKFNYLGFGKPETDEQVSLLGGKTEWRRRHLLRFLAKSSSKMEMLAEEDVLEPHPDIHALFCYYNSLYFGDSLGACSVSWSSSRMTRSKSLLYADFPVVLFLFGSFSAWDVRSGLFLVEFAGFCSLFLVSDVIGDLRSPSESNGSVCLSYQDLFLKFKAYA